MKDISTFDELLSIIESDKKNNDYSSGRYSTRVIFLDNFSKLKNLINSLNVDKIDLSKLLSSPTKWFTSDELIKIIQNCEESCVIFPLSEILRFYSDRQLQSFLTSVFESQNIIDKSKRIYIPLVGLYEKFSEEFWVKFHRQKEGAPVWKLSSFDHHDKVKIYKLNTEINTSIKLISNNLEWLDYWKSEIITPVINTSSTLNRRWINFLSDDCFESRILNDVSEFLNEIYSLNINYNFIEHEKEHWEQLLLLYEHTRKNGSLSFVDFLQSHFNIKNLKSYVSEQVLLLYLRCDKFEKWLIKLYLSSLNNNDNYLRDIVLECSEYTNSEVISKIYFNILNVESNLDNFIDQREKLIEEIYLDYIEDISKIIQSFVSTISSSESRDIIKFLTGHTFEEKQFIFSILKQMNEEEKMSLVNTKLYSVAKYLDWSFVKHQYESIDNWIIEYFEKYNKTKFDNQSSEEYDNLFNSHNKNSDTFFKWCYGIDELPDLNEKNVVQIDALSVEWLPYIVYIINKFGKEYNKELSSVTIHRAILPTITKYNKISNAEYIQDLDLLLHSNTGYRFPETFIKQLELIKKLVINVLRKTETKVYLTSDHGATCHCMKQFGRIKKYDFDNIEHEGRYLSDSKGMGENESFIKLDNYFIGLKHDSLNALPRREVHGGASPEEVLIPLLVIEQIDNQISYKFEIDEKIIDYNCKKLAIKIYPKPKRNPIVYINESIYTASLQNDLYIFDVSDLTPNKYKAKCSISNQNFNFEFQIIGGLKEEELF